MTSDTHEDLGGLLLAAVRELKTSNVDSDLPPDLNSEVLSQLTLTAPTNVRRPVSDGADRIQKKSRIMFVTKICSAVAAVALGIGFFNVWDNANNANNLFAQVASRFATVRSLTCRTQFVHDSKVEIMDGEFGDKLTYLAPSQYRVDKLNGSVEITDAVSETTMTVDHTAKEAFTITGEAAKVIAENSPVRFVQVVRQHLSLDRTAPNDFIEIVELESRTIDGVQATGFRSTMNGHVLEAWCDPDRHLPLLIRARFTMPMMMGTTDFSDVTMWRVLSDFQYDVEPNPELFSLTPPDGYKSVQMESPVIDHSPAGLDDLIAMLKKCATVNDLSFPTSLAMNDNQGTTMAIMQHYASGFDEQFESGTDAEKSEVMQKLTEFGTLLGRSQAFLLNIGPENDLQYFGGAKLNDTDRPLCWYSPDGNLQYKVVYADLSVHDVTKDELPEKPVVPPDVVADRNVTAAQKLKEIGLAVHDHPPENVVEVNTPTFKLPPQAVREYSELQAIRQSGRQSQVEYLVLGWMPEFIDSQVPSAGPEEEIKQVEVQPNWVPDRSPDSERFEFLREFPNLKGIDASHLYLTHRDLKAIASCHKLQRLSLNGIQIHEASARRLTGADLQQLTGLRELQVLDLSQSNFPGGLKHLSDLPLLHTLFLSSFEHLNDASVAELKELPHLKSLIMGPVYAPIRKRA